MAKKKEFLEDRAMKLYTEMLIEQLEQMEQSDWKKPWVASNVKGGPQNINGRPYSGFNPVLLTMLTMSKGYELPVFMTLRQAKAMDLTINKGAKGFPISFWNRIIHDKNGKNISEEEYERLPKEEQKQCRVFGFNKFFHVFNADQTNISEVKPELWEKIKERMMNRAHLKDENQMFKSPEIDWMLKNQKWVCPIHQVEGDKAYYAPTADHIVVPLKGQFDEGEAFYTTLLHEMVHSTGTEERLNRKDFSSRLYEDYAREELVAELGAALAAINLSINMSIKDESKQYLKAWLDNMRQSPQFLHSVMSDANRAVRMVCDNVITKEMQEAIKDETIESIGNFIEEKKAEEENRIPTVKPDDIHVTMRTKKEEEVYYIPSLRISDIEQLEPLMELHDAGLLNEMGDQAVGKETPGWIEQFIYAEKEMNLDGKNASVLRETGDHTVVLNNEVGNQYVDVYHKVNESFLRNMLRQWDVLNGVIANRPVTELAVRMAGEEVAAHPEMPRTVSLADGEELQWQFNAENGDIELGVKTKEGFENLYSRGVDLTKPLQATVDILQEFAEDDARIRQENTTYLKTLAEDLNNGKTYFQDASQNMEQHEVVPFRMTPRQTQVLLYPFLNEELRQQDPTYDGSKEYEQWRSDKEKLQNNIGKANTLDSHYQKDENRWTLPNGDKVQWKYDPYSDRIGIGHDNGYLFVKEMEFPVDNTKDILRNLEDIRSAVMEHYSRGNSLLPDLADAINNGRMTFVEAGDILQQTGHYPWNPSISEVKAYLHDLLRPELQGDISIGELAGRNPGWNLVSKEGLDYRLDFSKADKGWVTVHSDQGAEGYLQETLPLGMLKAEDTRDGLEALKEKAFILAEWQASLRKAGQAMDNAQKWSVDHTREIILPDFSVIGFEKGMDDQGKEAVFMGPLDEWGNVLPNLVQPMDELGLAATPAEQLADKAKVREFVIANTESLNEGDSIVKGDAQTTGVQVGKDIPMLRDFYRFKDKYPDALILFGNKNQDQFTVFQQDAETVTSKHGIAAVQSNGLTDHEGKPVQVLQFTNSQMDRIVSDAVRNGNRIAILDLDPEIERMVKDFLAENRVQDEEVAQTVQTTGKETKQEVMYYASVAYLQTDTDTARFDELKEAGKWDELLAEAAEYDQGDAVDLKEIRRNSEHYQGDNLLDENEHYAVVYNNSVGGTYDIQRKVPESEVWEMMRQQDGDYLELQDNPDLVPLLAGKVDEGYKAAMEHPQVIELANGERLDWMLKDVSQQVDFGKVAYDIEVGQMTGEGFQREHRFDYNLLQTVEENLGRIQGQLEKLAELRSRHTAAGKEPVFYSEVAFICEEDAYDMGQLQQKGQYREMMEAAVHNDQGLELDLQHTARTAEQRDNERLLFEDDRYALVQFSNPYNESEGRADNQYTLYRKVSENEVWESLHAQGWNDQASMDVKELAVKVMRQSYEGLKDQPQTIGLSDGETKDWKLEEVSCNGNPEYKIVVDGMPGQAFKYHLDWTLEANVEAVRAQLDKNVAWQEGEGQAEKAYDPTWYTKIVYLYNDKSNELGKMLAGNHADDILLSYALQSVDPEKRKYIDLEETEKKVAQKDNETVVAEDDRFVLVQEDEQLQLGNGDDTRYTYTLHEKIPESKVWEAIRQNGGVNGRWCTQDVTDLALDMMKKGYEAIKDQPQTIGLSDGETKDWVLKESGHQNFYIQVGKMDTDGLTMERQFYYDLEKTFSENLATIKEELEEQLGQRQAEGQAVAVTGGTEETVQQPQVIPESVDPEIEFRQGRNRVEVFVNQTQLGTISYDREWQPVQGADESLLQHPKVAESVQDMCTRGNMMQYNEEWFSTLVALKPLNPQTLVYDNPKVNSARTMLSVEEIDGQQVGVVIRDPRNAASLSNGEESPKGHVGLTGENLETVLEGKNPYFKFATPENLALMDERAERYVRAFEYRYQQALVFGDREQIGAAESHLKSALAYRHQDMDYDKFYVLEGQVRERVKDIAKQEKWLRSSSVDKDETYSVFVKTDDKRVFRPYSVLTDRIETPKQAMQHEKEAYAKDEVIHLVPYMQDKVKENGYEAFQIRDSKGKVHYDSRLGEGRLAQLSPDALRIGATPQMASVVRLPEGRGVEAVVFTQADTRSAGLVIHPDRTIEKTGNYPLTADSLRFIEDFARNGNAVRADDNNRLVFPPLNETTKLYDNVYELRHLPVSVEQVENEKMAVTPDGEIVARGNEVDKLMDNTPENRQAILQKADRYLEGYRIRIVNAVMANNDEEVKKQSDNYLRVALYRDQDAFDREKTEQTVKDIVGTAMVKQFEKTQARGKDMPANRIQVFNLRDGVNLGIYAIKDGVRSATRRLSDEDAKRYKEAVATFSMYRIDQVKNELADKYIHGQEQSVVSQLPPVAPEVRQRISEVSVKHFDEKQTYMVRAKIDGEQQMFRPVSNEDIKAYFEGLKGQPKEVVDERRAQLAAVYFSDELRAADQTVDRERGLHR